MYTEKQFEKRIDFLMKKSYFRIDLETFLGLVGFVDNDRSENVEKEGLKDLEAHVWFISIDSKEYWNKPRY